MNYKVMVVGLRFVSMLSFLGIAIGLLSSTWSQMVSATVEEVTNNTDAIMKFKQHKDNPTAPNPNEEAMNHINEAQSALQNGDTQGAQRHMDLAKQALICNPGDPAHC
jgi:hypothetical protein